MATSFIERLAGVVLAAEALVLAGIVGWEVTALVRGEAGHVPSSIALIVLTMIGAAALGSFAVSVWRRISWGRSGGIVAQLLILAVALGAATGQFADVGTAALIALPGAAGLAVLIAAARRAGREQNAA
ncbi:histidine kinase [Microbacterium radiodurans]|uniref:Histidine kinase n=1 Tax=Microbacterium radiodurans TaxID=661398 RepID=A0A5J5IQJ1_9MICO|nr:histidine kinase [Microbacterium radiodurans]KAA9085125.1 histidine kinase [Microbacterium radiodurans]